MGTNIYVSVSDHIPVYVIFKDSILNGSTTDDDSDKPCEGWEPWPLSGSLDAAAIRNAQVDCPSD